MATLEQHMMALAAQAHWRPPVADAQGVYRFSLEGDLAFAVFSSDGRVAVARGIVTPLPAASAALNFRTAYGLTAIFP